MDGSNELLWNDILRAIDRFMDYQPPKEFTLFTSGTGIPDETWIEFYKDMDIPIITRDGSTWRRGVRVE